MLCMTLPAEEGYGEFEQIVIYRSMLIMAIGALFGNIAMFKQEGADFFGMTTSAGFLLGHPDEILGVFRPMRIMAV